MTASTKPPIPPSVLPASAFYLASGTVTVDQTTRQILIIRNRATGTYQLPRGHKDWGEPLQTTAIRETFEETGARATLLPVPLSTRCTAPSTAADDPSHPYHGTAKAARFDPSGDVLLGGNMETRLTEPFALMQHRQPNGAWAVVLWYVAVADSRQPLACGTQMADELDYEAEWVDYGQAAGLMVNADCGWCPIPTPALFGPVRSP